METSLQITPEQLRRAYFWQCGLVVLTIGILVGMWMRSEQLEQDVKAATLALANHAHSSIAMPAGVVTAGSPGLITGEPTLQVGEEIVSITAAKTIVLAPDLVDQQLICIRGRLRGGGEGNGYCTQYKMLYGWLTSPPIGSTYQTIP